MNFLLDTNVVSEWTKPRPDPGLVAWLGEVDEDRVFISVVTLAELRHGVERLPSGARRSRLDAWLSEQVSARFESRILPVDALTAHTWGRVTALRETLGRPIGVMDALIAATAEQHDLALVTRNVSDYGDVGVHLVNPWGVP